MLTLDQIDGRIQEMAGRKSDVIMNLLTLTPTVEKGQVKLTTRRGESHGLIQNGMSSYLGRLDIPTGFFKKCDGDNKRSLLGQFHPEKGGQEVLLRKLDNDIRFIASSKYSCFDDKDIMKSLKETKMDLVIKEFHQDDGHTVLRATTPEPINIPNSRPFYPGIQIVNSEIGNSSVKVQYFLFEEVCTNGMVAARGDFPMFSMRHIGRKNHQKLSDAVNAKLLGLPNFAEMCETALVTLNGMSSEEMISNISRNEDIPKGIKAAIPEFLPNYQADNENASGLDVVSAMTESIQRYGWDDRLNLERVAGNYLLSAAA